MQKKTLLLLLMLIVSLTARPESRWKYYGAYHNSLVNIATSKYVLSLCDGSIFPTLPPTTK